ncbi:DUF222 domain-containing protein [Gordonia sp. VNQ95]|uniref:DUF222 domain-containing protein n=1 Tax=Gordonia sp. VNQ95 TaxID=3156619 RepID=UPI0032B5B6D7
MSTVPLSTRIRADVRDALLNQGPSPWPGLPAEFLFGVDVDRLDQHSINEVLVAMTELDRCRSYMAWLDYFFIAYLVTCLTDHRLDESAEYAQIVAEHIARTRNLANATTRRLVDEAIVMAIRLPKTGRALREGRISHSQFRTLIDRTSLLDPGPALHPNTALVDAAIADRLFERTGQWPATSLRDMADKIVFQHAPDAVREPRKRNLEKRGVFTHFEGDGTGEITGTMSAENITIAEKTISALADCACRKDPRTRRQRQADAMYSLLSGTQFRCDCGREDCPAVIPEPGCIPDVQIVLHVIADETTAAAIEERQRQQEQQEQRGRQVREQSAAASESDSSATESVVQSQRPESESVPEPEPVAEADAGPAQMSLLDESGPSDADSADAEQAPEPAPEPQPEPDADVGAARMSSRMESPEGNAPNGEGTPDAAVADTGDDSSGETPLSDAQKYIQRLRRDTARSSEDAIEWLVNAERRAQETAATSADTASTDAESGSAETVSAAETPIDGNLGYLVGQGAVIPEQILDLISRYPTTIRRMVPKGVNPEDVELPSALPSDPCRLSTALDTFIRIRHGECVIPACRGSAFDGDCDHVHEYDHEHPELGGQTTPDGLNAKCRGHHLQKTHSRWLDDQYRDENGRLVTVFTTPEGLNIPGPAETLEDFFGGLRRYRFADPPAAPPTPREPGVIPTSKRDRLAAKYERRRRERERNRARITDGVDPLNPPRPKRRKKRYPVVPDDGAPPPF